MAKFENEDGALETIADMSDARLGYVIRLLNAEDPENERSVERAAIEAEIAERTAYFAERRVALEAAGVNCLAFGKRFKAWEVINGKVEGLSIPALARAETEDQAWTAVVRAIDKRRS